MTEKEFRDWLYTVLNGFTWMNDADREAFGTQHAAFMEDAEIDVKNGALTLEKGLILELKDGSVFVLTVKKTN